MKTKIKKGITRQIQTKQFEQLIIVTEIEEEVEWKDEKEREKEAERLTNRLLEDFKKVYNTVCKNLDIERCIGAVKVASDGKKVAPSSKKKVMIEDGNDDFDILD